LKIFGFTLGKKDVTQVEPAEEKSFALPTAALDDGAITVTQNAYYGTYVDLEGSVRNELELITRYREMSNHPELESAIDDIVNEAITHSEDGSVVQINTDNLKQPDSIKKKIAEEYDYVLKLLNFSNLADDLFRRWYIDGRIYFHVLVNEKNPKEGIKELRYIDPRKIRKIREINKERDPVTGANIIKSMAEYYVYNDKGTSTQTYTASVNPGIKVAPDSIINVNSGLMDAKNNFVISPLHSAIRPLNQLRMIEDAIVIYRLCLTGDTRIKTNTGWKYIKDIKENDIVYSYYGPELGLKETLVKKQWKTGTKQTYTVSSKHFSITGTDNHPILVLDKNTNIVEYVDIKDISPKQHCFVYQKPEETFTNNNYDDILDDVISGKISNLIFNSSNELKKEFIVEYCDKNGIVEDSINSGTWSAKLKLNNKELIDDIKETWTSLGLASSLIEYDDNFWFITLFDYELPNFENILSVEQANVEDVYELEVVSEKHNFIANGVCVHNSRAPERRVFYIDVGNLPKGKAEQYLRDVMVKYRNKLTYDAATGCLAMDTKVPLLDGRTLSIAEISDELKNDKILWAYSCDPITGKFAPGLITWAGVTQKSAKVMKITFDNGKSVICTLDHNHVTKQNGFVQAKDLKIGDSIMPFYKRFSPIRKGKSEYEQIFENDSKKWKFTHRLVSLWKDENGMDNEWVYNNRFFDEQKLTIHHKNKNRYDNSIYNLVKMNRLDHFDYHKQHCSDAGKLGGKKTAENKIKQGIPFFNLTKEQYIENGRKVGTIVGKRMVEEKKGIHGLSKDEIINNARLGGKTLSDKLQNNDEFAKSFSENVKLSWTEDRRNNTSIRAKNLPKSHFIKLNKLGNDVRWNSVNGESNREHLSNLYTIKYTQEILDSVLCCAKSNMSISNAIDYINTTIDFIEWQNYNNKTVNAKFDLSIFVYYNLLKVVKLLGYDNYKSCCDYYNPKIKKQTNSDYNPGDMNRIIYPDYIEKLLYECASINLNTKKSLEYISDKINYDDWNNLNVRSFSHKRPTLNKFTEKDLYRFMHSAGFNTWKDYKESLLHYNHKIVKIEYLDEEIEVGTLTIDGNELYHNFHTFALDCGIYTKNSVVDSRKHLSMLEDFFLPRREGSRGTEITTLPAGAALNDLPDLEYFKKKLLQSLHVPYSRMDNDNGGGIAVFGRSAETSRDELKFGKFIQRLRNKFSQLFDDALRIQLALKGICSTEEWEEFKESIYYDFRKDNNFVELREAELIRERMITLQQVDPYIGKYFSQTWVKKNILRMSNDEIEEMDKEMQDDGSVELYQQQLNMQSGMQPPEPIDNTYDAETSPSMTPNLDDKVAKFSS
jgi:hypothetical protein